MTTRKKIIIGVLIVVVIIIIIVSALIYSNNKKRKEQEAQQQMFLLQQQLNQPNLPTSQKQGIINQIANLASVLQGLNINIPKANSNTPVTTSGQGQVYGPSPAPTSTTATNVPAPAGFPLKVNSSGPYVTAAQKAINAKCGSSLATDGKFGPKTESGALSCIGTKTISWTQYQSLIGLYGS
jgi:hypothetical protein